MKTQFQETAEQRGIPFAKKGMRVEVAGKPGLIKNFNIRANLDVLFDGEKEVSNCHPTWEIVYFDKSGKIIKDFRGEK